MNKKNIILISIIVFLLLIIIFGTVYYIATINNIKKPEDNPIKIDKNIVMYDFGQAFISNVKESKRVLKVSISIELANSKISELIEGRKPEIVNKINLILRDKKEEDLSGAQGQLRLQNEILAEIRKILNTDKVLNIFFSEFIVQ